MYRCDPKTIVGLEEPNRYAFLGNNPISRTDYLGLVNWEKRLEKWEELIEHQTPGGDFAAAIRVFGSCQSLGLALGWAKRQYDDCMAAAITGDPKKNCDAEKECDKKWKKRIRHMQRVYDNNCAGKD